MLALAAVLVAAPATAQVYRFRQYNSNSGLPSNATYAVFQDSHGFIWFATDGGACRYDGVVYKTYSVAQGLPDASVRGFVEDREGALWVLTKDGLARWDGTRFRTFGKAEGLRDTEIRSGLLARDGTLWFGTASGLARWDGARFTSFGPEHGLSGRPVWTIHEDRAGIIWVGIRGSGLARFTGERFEAVGKAEGFAATSVFDITEDDEDRLWVATDDGLHVREEGRFRVWRKGDAGLPGSQVSTVLVDSRGRLWAGLFGAGAARLEPDGRFKVFNRRHGTPDDYITSMLEDAEGNMWFGSMWSGAFRLVTERFSAWGEDLGLPDGMISQVAEDDAGGLWFGAINGGLARRSPEGVVRRYGVAEGLHDDRIWSLLVDRRNRLWVGGLFGAAVLDGERFRTWSLRELGAFDRISTLAEDERGWIWLGSGAARSSGVLVWNGETFRRYGPADGLGNVQVNSISAGRHGRVWIGTEDGLYLFDGQRFVGHGVGAGLPSRRVLVAREDARGRLWAGTSGGLALLETDRFRVWRSGDGLVNDFVSALVDHGDTLWIGTARGVSAFDGQTFRNFTVHQGLPSHEIVTGTGLRASDGTLWFGTPVGALRYDPVPETAREQPPRVLLRGVRVDDDASALQSRVVLPHDHRHLTIDFVGLSFADEEAVRYTSMLEGLDPVWSEPDPSRTVRFMNLPPGRYTFLVKARAGGSPWGEPARIDVEVLPALWQRRSVQVGAVLLVVLLAWAIYAWRVRTLQARARERIATLRQLLDSIRVINSTLDLPSVLQSIAAEAARLVGAEPGGIGLVRDGQVVFPRLFVDGAWDPVDHHIPVGHGVVGSVAATGRPSVINDPVPGLSTGFPVPVVDRYAHGMIDVPILDRNGNVVGVLDVRRPEGREPFDDADRSVLDSLAPQAAIAIENAGLYGTLEEKKIVLSESLWAVEQLYRNEQQANRILQELNDMKTNFMIVTSHELRTPLTIIKGHHEALLGGYLGEVSASQGSTLQICQRNVDRMIDTFDDIIEMMKIDRRAPLRPEPLDVAAELGEVLQELSSFVERRRQHVEVQNDDGLPLVVGDSEKLQLVFENVLQNAIKFTPDGGRIRVVLSAQGENVRISVEDEGVGIERDDLERIFERFFTSRDSLHHGSGTWQFMARGAGLGLAIAKGYVEAHGGRIWAESDGLDKGSRFHVLLPALVAPGSLEQEAQTLLAAS